MHRHVDALSPDIQLLQHKLSLPKSIYLRVEFVKWMNIGSQIMDTKYTYRV